jgi:ketosteroid isomerase-like protein
MPTNETLERFVAMVVDGKHDQAIEDFYTPDASMQENLDPPRVGSDSLVARERAVMASFKSIGTECVRPFFVNGDHVVIRWVFEFQRADGGKMRMEELAHQRWQGEKIVEERFYYDPKQMQVWQ